MKKLIQINGKDNQKPSFLDKKLKNSDKKARIKELEEAELQEELNEELNNLEES